MLTAILLVVSLTVPGIALAFARRNKIPASRLPLLGGIAGLLPIAISALWAVGFIIYYGKSYDFDGMQRMDAYKFLNYPLLAISSPLSANLVWLKSAKSVPLMKWRFLLIAAFLAESVLAENVPVGWTFTFFYVPPCLLAMLIGFTFIKRHADLNCP